MYGTTYTFTLNEIFDAQIREDRLEIHVELSENPIAEAKMQEFIQELDLSDMSKRILDDTIRGTIEDIVLHEVMKKHALD